MAQASSYTISFVILGVYWVGHHLQLAFIRTADRLLLWINMLFLLFVALVPFSTALLSEYTNQRVAIAVYGANLIAIQRRHGDADWSHTT